jgi:chromate reductase
MTLLLVPGALRRASTNRLLAAEAARLYGEDDPAWADLRMPLYDGDLETEAGLPLGARALADAIEAAEAVVIATPEYNQSFPGVLKNALDWVSRAEGRPWRDKPVAIVSAAAGRSGGARSQYALRLALTPFRPRLLTGPEVLVAEASRQFEDGRLTNERNAKALSELMTALRRAATGA